ncbi:low molecular weight protein-tyrosine-phosphatase [Labrenzia sp. VG12]|uniref:low molecular weight protein-tyrosine-phosphatase n=1 Tax=Labrenzia sp. VG12 TaxID=2021862 RepID=UPI000B8BD975|nr:low molecular weight protein-tyrosine-phosphatase [Labrenzia sp. VG12]ASP34962.1 protein tyrosine phosphatase [Labrenzia sp. VG12]
MPHAVLFVCLGNICRSPLAEGIFRSLVDEAGASDRYLIDSAGTGAWHSGNPPDPRSIEVAARHGIDLSTQRARQVYPDDFQAFDTIIAMDRDNLTTLKARDTGAKAQLRLLLADPAADVPDPYYGGPEGFDHVFGLVRKGCQDLLTDLERSG